MEEINGSDAFASSRNTQSTGYSFVEWKSQGHINWSGFFGESGEDPSVRDGGEIIENTGYGYRGIYKGDFIKERVALTATQIFCADTTEVCFACYLPNFLTIFYILYMYIFSKPRQIPF